MEEMLVKVRGFFLPILTSKSAELILGFDPLLYLLTCKMNQFSSSFQMDCMSGYKNFWGKKLLMWRDDEMVHGTC